jgi:acyl carrier protein
MQDARQRLIKCFSAVFPELTEDEIVGLEGSASGQWDSLSLVTLLAVTREEFGFEIAPDVDGLSPVFDSFLKQVVLATGEPTPTGPPAGAYRKRDQ